MLERLFCSPGALLKTLRFLLLITFLFAYLYSTVTCIYTEIQVPRCEQFFKKIIAVYILHDSVLLPISDPSPSLSSTLFCHSKGIFPFSILLIPMRKKKTCLSQWTRPPSNTMAGSSFSEELSSGPFVNPKDSVSIVS